MIQIQGELTQNFKVARGLHQDVQLSTILFNLFLEKVICKVTRISGKVEFYWRLGNSFDRSKRK